MSDYSYARKARANSSRVDEVDIRKRLIRRTFPETSLITKEALKLLELHPEVIGDIIETSLMTLGILTSNTLLELLCVNGHTYPTTLVSKIRLAGVRECALCHEQTVASMRLNKDASSLLRSSNEFWGPTILTGTQTSKKRRKI